MNFDRLAAHYHWMEHVFAGGLMQRCRITFLPRTSHCRRALLVGEGTGKFLVELLRHNPHLQIVCLEQCAGMIEQIRQRLKRAGLDASRVEFKQMDAFNWPPPAQAFDLIATNFFLDCFRAEQLQQLVPQLARSATPDAVWLLADFCVPDRGWRRVRAALILAALYAFFKITTALPANWLTPPDRFLTDAGFRLAERRRANFGLTHADLWRRTT